MITIAFIQDRQYTVYLNITNEDYKEGLRDHESLEFLNFAQAVRAAVSTERRFERFELRLSVEELEFLFKLLRSFYFE